MDAGSYSTDSPSAFRQGIFPSPTYSLSSMSSGHDTTLCTPEHHKSSSNTTSHHLKQETDIQAANARFNSFKGQGNVMLAEALEFGSGTESTVPSSAAMTTSSSTLGKRLGHTRNNSSISRRHSIQSMMPSQGSELQDIQRRYYSGQDTCSPLSLKKEIGSFEDDLQLWQNETEHLNFDLAMSTMQSNDFLMSPPRLTVSLASQHMQHLQDSKKKSESDESKRRRTTALSVMETPQRPMSAQTIMQHTPPNNWTQMQAHAASIHSSAASSRISQTPISMTSSLSRSSIFESGGSTAASSLRRRSSIQGDCISQIATLTAGSKEDEFNVTNPLTHTAKIDFADLKMTKIPSTKSSSPLERTDSKSEKTKGPDVWPDDVEVAFWEGELYIRHFEAYPAHPFYLLSSTPHPQARKAEGLGTWKAVRS
jgi:hypothetical protein